MKQKIKLIFLVLSLLAGVAGVSLAQAATDVFTATGTWTAPVGVTSVDVEVWGGIGVAGGDGGAERNNNTGRGGHAGLCRASSYGEDVVVIRVRMILN